MTLISRRCGRSFLTRFGAKFKQDHTLPSTNIRFTPELLVLTGHQNYLFPCVQGVAPPNRDPENHPTNKKRRRPKIWGGTPDRLCSTNDEILHRENIRPRSKCLFSSAGNGALAHMRKKGPETVTALGDQHDKIIFVKLEWIQHRRPQTNDPFQSSPPDRPVRSGFLSENRKLPPDSGRSKTPTPASRRRERATS